ncbi:hypothetical protein [Chitinophaga sp.]|uniref:hypothetical protein n=1 Tax=Chitinophaga sp. TaxID=1869181 RepID=UPI0026229257|nr:hypothetical protein [uncultured Chitinophaga sp.]
MHKFRILHPNAITKLRMQPVMHGMIGILFLFNVIGVYKMEDPNWLMALLFIALGTASLAFPFMMRKMRKMSETNSVLRLLQVFTLFSGSLFFLSHMQPIIGGTLLLAGLGVAYTAYAEYRIMQPAYAEIGETGITLPTVFGKKAFRWNEMNNVVLRNDLLTLDFRSNKVLQLDVLDEYSPAQTAEINAFFQSKLT